MLLLLEKETHLYLFPRPRPIAKTKGTVTGPVVTPALSHATLTNSSVEKYVNTTANKYNGINTVARSKANTILPTPWDDLSEGYGISTNELTLVASLPNFNNDNFTGSEIVFGSI